MRCELEVTPTDSSRNQVGRHVKATSLLNQLLIVDGRTREQVWTLMWPGAKKKKNTRRHFRHSWVGGGEAPQAPPRTQKLSRMDVAIIVGDK